MRVDEFDYPLPETSIAQSAMEPRDRSRLMRTADRSDHIFAALPDLLRAGDLLVVNRTRVRAARLVGEKPASGGRIELLLLRRIDLERWEALVKPARRIRPGVAMKFGTIAGEALTHPDNGVVTVALHSPEGDVEAVLARVGEVPLPPYFHGELVDPDRYQTMFARSVGSAAAPTAALHFTPGLVDRLASASIDVAEVELDVGLDTFRPMATDTVAEHVIHHERYRVPEATAARIGEVRNDGGRIVAVGTTVVRTLETAADTAGGVVAGEGESSLFITPGYRFSVVDAMLTNFHAPRTTLIALIAAALGPQWRDIYTTALARGYRFLSFGDSMLIEGLGDRHEPSGEDGR